MNAQKTYTYRITKTEIYELTSDKPLDSDEIFSSSMVNKWEEVDTDTDVEEI